MSHFDRLHPALQHHIVNSFGWRELRTFQDAVIPSILAGHHLIVVAPTAGGKTEAAIFPLLSRMLTEDWKGLSVLYVCPLRALLNNLDVRLRRYCELLGRRSALWHGDIGTADRRAILRDPPDCLLTTPESLELMLTSPTVDERHLFGSLQSVVVDEIHAFAGDDRGWHLLAVLERITRVAHRELQRIGLSATVGNPDALGEWLAGHCEGRREVFSPKEATGATADVTLDHVGSIENAALVISRMHRGEKRLVFVDSRSRAETLSTELRRHGVATWVTHSSLSREERLEAENAFATRDDCVIVATSVLELGVDVGDLDRVIQIDSPSTVASFLQRMGRTGRRSGSRRNCLFLSTRDESLLQAAALIDLWAEGFVEPIIPPLSPFHVLAQQLMALILQEGGIGERAWFEWVRRMPAFGRMDAARITEVVRWMLDAGILWEDQGILGIGVRGDENFGRRNFMELLSVFLSPPLFAVLHGNREIGFVDELTFVSRKPEPHVLLLGGRPWQVKHVDWQRHVAYVDISEGSGVSRWKGAGRSLSYRLCQTMKAVFVEDGLRDFWSRRAREAILRLRSEFPWVTPNESAVVRDPAGDLRWWTFAGAATNATLSAGLDAVALPANSIENLSIGLDASASPDDLKKKIDNLRTSDHDRLYPRVDETAIDGLKFSQCLPREIAVSVLEQRIRSQAAITDLLSQPIRFVSQ